MPRLGDLKPDKNNARRHTAKGQSLIETSLRTDGFGRSILLDAEGNILAGNGVTEAATGIFEDVLIVPSDGTRVIAIQRTDVQPGSERAVRLAIADNRANELSDFDPAVVAALANEVDLSDFWRDDELDALLAGIETEQEAAGDDPGAQIDKAGALREKWDVRYGDLWAAGDHRILCGDSTNADDAARLMDGAKLRLVWTDPPYGVSYGAKNEFLNAIARGNHIQTPLDGDQGSGEDTEALTRDALILACAHGVPGAACYVASPAGTPLPHMIAAVAASGFSYRWQLVWVKQQFVLGRSDYHFRHENILYGWKAGAHYFVDDHTLDSVFEVDKPHVSDLHPTTKPVELVQPMIENSSKPGEIVYDPFLGSGTTLVACAQSGRIGYGMELTPAYTAVAIERLSGMGLTPRLVARDGTTDD